MKKTVADVRRERVAKYKTGNQKYSDFSVGMAVQIIVPCQDFYFFYDETGVVVSNSGEYLGIRVKFDKPRKFEDGHVQESFNFEPQDLLILKQRTACPHCGGKL